MALELLRNGEVWLEYNSTFYRLHVSRDISFSQTFKQDSIQKRTLHSLNDLYQGSVITEANPANFEIVLYIIQNDSNTHQHKPLDLLLNYNGNILNQFTLYFVYPDNNPQVYYKIENCVFTSGTFNIVPRQLVTVSLSGQGTELIRDDTTGWSQTLHTDYTSSPQFTLARDYTVSVNSSTLSNIVSASIELQNNIEWTKNATVQSSLAVTSASNTIYPGSFTFSGRTLGGSIQQYIDSSGSDSNVQTWNTGTAIDIEVGQDNYSLQFNLPSCSFTNRVNTGDIFIQNYDFRLVTNPQSQNYITY